MSPLARVRALVGVAVALLAHDRLRTVLAVVGVAMAVLASVVLVSVGVGVLATGQEKFDQSGRDLWVTGGPVEFSPGTVGGFQNSLVGAHEIAREIGAREDVQTAVPMAFQTVYASADGEDFQTVVGAGAPARGPSVTITDGQPFQEFDDHYAEGSYDGPMTREAVLDERAAALLNVSVGDTIHVGGTLATARAQEFRVVGISPTYSRFVGAPTITLHLSELQEVTGTAASDRGTFVTVALADGADVGAVERDLEATYPDYEIRTNAEQLQSTLADQALVLVSGASLIGLAALAGVLLLVNLQLSFVARYRETFAAILAIGTTRSSLALVVLVHTISIGILGGVLGVVLAVPSVEAVNAIAAALTGFEDVARVSQDLLVGGLVLAVLVSGLAGLVASLSLARVRPLEQLR